MIATNNRLSNYYSIHLYSKRFIRIFASHNWARK